MVSTAALVLVFLQLHASNTQREEQYEAGSNRQLTSSSQPPDVLKSRTSERKPMNTISRADEDLLDLMVRIAETPAEWERIHRVLTQIGREKAALDNKVEEKMYTKPKHTTDKNVTKSKYSPLTNSSSEENYLVKTTATTVVNYYSSVGQTTMSPLTTDLKEFRDSDYPNDTPVDHFESEADTGWPDFDEAIAKKVKRHRSEKQNNKIIESDWFDDEWLDTAWVEPQTHKKDDQNSLGNEAKVSYPAVSFRPVQITETKQSIDATHVRSPLFSDPKILEFPLEHTQNLEGQKFVDEMNSSINPNKTTRPIFQYHRVTTSPQERKGNSAFIAVSVVKHTAPESAATTVTPSTSLESPWIYERNMYRPQDQEDEISSNRVARKHPHWSKGNHHHHNRGHRHYRTHTHGHP